MSKMLTRRQITPSIYEKKKKLIIIRGNPNNVMKFKKTFSLVAYMLGVSVIIFNDSTQ